MSYAIFTWDLLTLIIQPFSNHIISPKTHPETNLKIDAWKMIRRNLSEVSYFFSTPPTAIPRMSRGWTSWVDRNKLRHIQDFTEQHHPSIILTRWIVGPVVETRG